MTFATFSVMRRMRVCLVVNELVSRALSFARAIIEKKRIRIELDEEPDVTAEGYPNEYVQAFLNIILNARDAVLESSGGKSCVTIPVFRENGRSVVTVTR